MKKHIIALFLLISLVSACTQTKTGNKHPVEAVAEDIVENQIVTDIILADQPIVIGGYTTRYTLSRHVNSSWFAEYIITIGEGKSVDFSGIEQLRNTKRLYITLLDTGNVDFSPLGSLSNLEFLSLGGWGLTLLPDLGNIPSVIWMEINSGRLTNLDGIEKIHSLKSLEISGNRVQLTDVSALRYLKNLKSFHFYSGYQNIDFSVFRNLPELKEIRLGGGGEYDLSGIGQAKTVEILELSSNTSKILPERSVYKNIEEIGKMTGLKELFLDESIKSVEFLAGNVNLEHLTLVADKERDDYFEVLLPLDVKPISNFKKLKRLVIRGFELKNVNALDTLLPNLERFDTELYQLE